MPLPYVWVMVFLGVLGAGGQIAEHYLRDPGFAQVERSTITSGLVFVGLLVYILAHLRYSKREAVQGLNELRSSVLVEDEIYDSHVSRVLDASWWVELLLLVVATGVALAFFFAPPRELITAAGSLPGGPWLAIGYGLG